MSPRTNGREKRREAFRPVNPKRIGDVIRDRRLSAGLTQEQLAALLFVSQVSVSRWEGGTRIPGGPELVDLMALLEFTKHDIS